ncbi:MAG TPA: sigma-54-dependent Fis family transcriptional regulator [Chondromyces sp.]|nr:sigma-54-dependent Fis family transcriptional regulator [Chondromyces sp.]
MHTIYSYKTRYQHPEESEKERSLKNLWVNYFKKGINLGGIRPVIMESWKRSQTYKVNPNVIEAPSVCDNDEMIKKRDRYKEILSLIRPFMDDLFEIVKGTDSIIAFADKDGVVLELFGDSEIVLNAASANFKVGVNMSEECIGTNAIGTALVLGRALQVVGAEHYCVAWHTSHCSSAPIKNPYTNEVIGVLTLIGYLPSAHAHSLGLVKTAAEMIVKLIEQQGIQHEKYIIDNYFSAAMDSISDGVLIVNRSGEIIRSNKIASHLLSLPLEEHQKYKISEIEQLQPLSIHLEDIIRGNEIILQKELRLLHDEKFRLLLTSRKIVIGEEHIGTIIILKKKHNKEIKRQVAKYHFSSLVGEDPRFKQAIKLAVKGAKTDKSILIIGESGTGKELFAQAIHNESTRQAEPFLAINCAAIPKDLIASELFGYAEGAFTNAAKGGKQGKFEAANGGTIFLDEIGDMPLELQAHLLRVLEEKEIMPVGSNLSKPIDVRVIAATNKNLLQLVKEDKFRLDLFYRLNVISIKIPPLRKRKHDIDLFIRKFLPAKNFNAEALACLYDYHWPGNLREMRNVMEQIDIFCDDEVVAVDYIPEYIMEQLEKKDDKGNLYQSVTKETKRDTLIVTLKASRSVSEAAQKLGVSSSTLYRWASEYEINIKQYMKNKQVEC